MPEDEKETRRELKERSGSDEGPDSGEGLPWKKILGISLIIVLTIGLLWTFKPWQRLAGKSPGGGSTGGAGENQQGENVLFTYQATFSYEDSEHGKPLENLVLSFPAPNIDNEISTNQLSARGWKLEYVDNENVIWPEIGYNRINDNIAIYELKGDRTTQLQTFQGPSLEHERIGPKLEYQLSELYPNEQFTVFYYVVVDNKNADGLTLLDAGENQRTSASYYWPWGYAENKAIDFYFDVQLARQVGYNQTRTVERFIRHYENGPSHWYWLYLL